MPNSGPPWVQQSQQVIVVQNIPVPEQPATEFPVDGFGYVSTLSSSDQLLKRWTVTAGRVGVCRIIELASDCYSVAQFTVNVRGVAIISAQKFPSAFNKEYPDLHLLAAEVVEVYVKSDGVTTIQAWCDIGAKELGLV